MWVGLELEVCIHLMRAKRWAWFGSARFDCRSEKIPVNWCCRIIEIEHTFRASGCVKCSLRCVRFDYVRAQNIDCNVCVWVCGFFSENVNVRSPLIQFRHVQYIHLIAANWWSIVAMVGFDDVGGGCGGGGGDGNGGGCTVTETVGVAVTDSRPRDSFSISAPNWCNAVMADGVGSRKLLWGGEQWIRWLGWIGWTTGWCHLIDNRKTRILTKRM